MSLRDKSGHKVEKLALPLERIGKICLFENEVTHTSKCWKWSPLKISKSSSHDSFFKKTVETIKTCNFDNSGSFSISRAKISKSYDLMKVFNKSTSQISREFNACVVILKFTYYTSVFPIFFNVPLPQPLKLKHSYFLKVLNYCYYVNFMAFSNNFEGKKKFSYGYQSAISKRNLQTG